MLALYVRFINVSVFNCFDITQNKELEMGLVNKFRQAMKKVLPQTDILIHIGIFY